MVHTHTPAHTERVTLDEGWTWRWRDDQPTPTKGPPGRSQRQPKRDSNNSKEGGGGKKQGEGEKTAPSSTTSTTGSALVGTGFGVRFTFDEQQHATPNTRGGGGRNKEEKDTNTPPTLATTRASPEREGKSRERTPRKADQRKRRRWGGGRTTPRKPEKDTEDLTQPNLPGDATDQPNPNTKTHYREGPKGDKQITTVTKSCVTSMKTVMLSQPGLNVRVK